MLTEGMTAMEQYNTSKKETSDAIRRYDREKGFFKNLQPNNDVYMFMFKWSNCKVVYDDKFLTW